MKFTTIYKIYAQRVMYNNMFKMHKHEYDMDVGGQWAPPMELTTIGGVFFF